MTKPVTRLYPYEPPRRAALHGRAGAAVGRHRGRDRLRRLQHLRPRLPGRLHLPHRRQVRRGEDDKKNIVRDYFIDLGRCSYCGICVEVCPFDANEMTPHFELEHLRPPAAGLRPGAAVEIARGVERRMGKPEPEDVPVVGALDTTAWR